MITVPRIAFPQDTYPPRDESGKSQTLQAFVNRLGGVISSRDVEGLMKMLHPRIKFDFDEGEGIDKFKKAWQLDSSSSLWPILKRIVDLGGVFVANGDDPFYKFVFPYVNEINLEDGDDYFSTLVVTGKNVNVREKPQMNSKVTGQLSYKVVQYDYARSTLNDWYFISTRDKTVSGYIKAELVYSPVDYRMFLTDEGGEWRISCIIAGD